MKHTQSAQEKQAQTRHRGSVQSRFVQARQIQDHLLCLSTGFVNILAVEGMSYDLKSPEEQLVINEQFQRMLAGLSYPVQILWRVLPLNLDDYLEQMVFPVDQTEMEGIWPLLSSTHATFLQQLAQRRTLLKRTIYLILRVDGRGKPQSRAQRLFTRKRSQHWQQQVEQARQDLDLRSSEIMRQLGDMGLFVRRLRGEQEIAPFYSSCLTPAKADRFPLPPAVIDALNRPIQAPHLPKSSHPIPSMEQQDQALARAGGSSSSAQARGFGQLADLVAPAAIVVQPDCLIVEKEYTRTLLVHHLPRTVSAGWLKPLADLDEPMEVSFHLEPLSSASMIQQLRRQHRAYHSSQMMARGKGNDADPNTQIASEDVNDLLPRLASGEERMLTVSLLVQVRGSSKRVLNERTERIQAVLHTMLLVAHTALFEQEQAFRSCLPHGNNEMSGMVLDSRSASTFFPFLSNTLFHPQGILEGVTPQGDPVIVDPWGEGMPNANRLIIGPPGGGKSHGIKTTLTRRILKAVCAQHKKHQQHQTREELTYQAISIDPEGEYIQKCRLFGGQVIHLSPGSAQRINPFDLPRVREEDLVEHRDYLADHVQKLHTLLEIMLADHTPTKGGTLKSDEKGLLDRAFYEAYRMAGITTDRRTHGRAAPLMRTVYDVLKSGTCGQDTTGLTQRLERFVHGSLSGLFAGPTNVSLDRVMVDFDIKGLETELRPVGLFLVSNFVWTQSFHSKIPRLLIVDEAATLMMYESGRLFLEDLVRRARKHFLGVVVITQHPGILQDSSIPSNCATHVLMRQDATTLDLVQQMFHLSSREVQLLRRLPAGEALFLTNEKRLHLRFEASEVEHLLATTDPREIAGWPERCRQDAEFAQLLHQLGLDEAEKPEEEQITAKLPILKVGQPLHVVVNGHQNWEA
jgi:hypothetical protein